MDIKRLLLSPAPLSAVNLDGTYIEKTSVNIPATSEHGGSPSASPVPARDSAGSTLVVADPRAKAVPSRDHDSDNSADLPGGGPPDDGLDESAARELPRRPTPAEKARENKLRADPLVEICNAQLVRCQRCCAFIKLSAKSAFDPAHWNKHRERCARRSEAVVQELRETNSEQSAFPSDVNVKPRKAARRKTAVAKIPPLTPDREGESSASSVRESTVKEESPAPQLDEPMEDSPPVSPSPPPSPPMPAREPDPAFDEYLARSQRRAMRDLSPQHLTSWQTWSWSQLKRPVWCAERLESDDGAGDEDDDDEDRGDHFPRARVSAERSREDSPPLHYPRLSPDKPQAD